MIFHRVNTIKVGDFSEMYSLKDYSKCLRLNIWLPKFILRKYYNRLIAEWNSINNKKEIAKELNNNKHKIKQLNQINIQYRVLLDAIAILNKLKVLKAKDSDIKKWDNIVNESYYSIYKKKPIFINYDKIKKDLDLKIKKFKQRFLTIRKKKTKRK